MHSPIFPIPLESSLTVPEKANAGHITRHSPADNAANLGRTPSIPIETFSTTTKDLYTLEKQNAELNTRRSKDSGSGPDDGLSVPSIIAYPPPKSSETAYEVAEPAMSYDTGYIRIPRSLLNDTAYKTASPYHRIILIHLIELAVWKECKFNVKGAVITLNPGQCCFSERELAARLGVGRQMIRGCLRYFATLNFLTHQVTHKKTVVTITHKDTYDLINYLSNPTPNPTATQQQPIKEEDKNIRKKKNLPANTPKVGEDAGSSLATTLLDGFHVSLFAAIPDFPKEKAKRTRSQLQACDRLLKRYTLEVIKEAIAYAHTPGGFWVKFVHSMTYLERKMITLLEQIKNPITLPASANRSESKLRGIKTEKDTWQPPPPTWGLS